MSLEKCAAEEVNGAAEDGEAVAAPRGLALERKNRMKPSPAPTASLKTRQEFKCEWSGWLGVLNLFSTNSALVTYLCNARS